VQRSCIFCDIVAKVGSKLVYEARPAVCARCSALHGGQREAGTLRPAALRVCSQDAALGLVAFRDHRPAASAHFLVIPKAHVATVYDLRAGPEDASLGAGLLVLCFTSSWPCFWPARPPQACARSRSPAAHRAGAADAARARRAPEVWLPLPAVQQVRPAPPLQPRPRAPHRAHST